jgi:hypothetical protein
MGCGKKRKKKRNYYILKKLNKGIRALVEYARYIDKPMYILCETYLYVKKKVKLNVKFDKKKKTNHIILYIYLINDIFHGQFFNFFKRKLIKGKKLKIELQLFCLFVLKTCGAGWFRRKSFVT